MQNKNWHIQLYDQNQVYSLAACTGMRQLNQAVRRGWGDKTFLLLQHQGVKMLLDHVLINILAQYSRGNRLRIQVVRYQ